MAARKSKTPKQLTTREKFELICEHVYNPTSPLFQAANSADVNGRDTAEEHFGHITTASEINWTRCYEQATVDTWEDLVGSGQADSIY